MIGWLAKLFRRAAPAVVVARPRDAAALAGVHGRSFPVGWSEPEFERMLADPSMIAHAARDDGGRGNIIGFVLSRIAADEAEILSVAVTPAARGGGIAGALLQRHLGRLAALGIARIFLEVGEDNEPALALYEKAGFRAVGKRAGYYPRPGGAVSALTLKRELA